MKRILFQGDSITDAGRLRGENEDGKNLGFGYPAYAAAELGTAYPQEFEFINKAIGGSKITDLYARAKRDIINLKPDYLSIMIGINDVWHKMDPVNDGVDNEKFELFYDLLIGDIKKALPDIKIMIIEPYCDKVTAGFCEGFNDEVLEKARISKKIAEKYQLAFMETQLLINKAEETAPTTYWTVDGVHPTIFGHKLIADEWKKVFEKMK